MLFRHDAAAYASIVAEDGQSAACCTADVGVVVAAQENPDPQPVATPSGLRCVHLHDAWRKQHIRQALRRGALDHRVIVQLQRLQLQQALFQYNTLAHVLVHAGQIRQCKQRFKLL